MIRPYSPLLAHEQNQWACSRWVSQSSAFWRGRRAQGKKNKAFQWNQFKTSARKDGKTKIFRFHFFFRFSPNWQNWTVSITEARSFSVDSLTYLLGNVKWLWLTQIYGARCRTKSFRTRSSSNTRKLALLILCFHLIHIAIDPFQSDSWLHIPRHLLAANVLASSSNLVTIPLSCSCHPVNPMHCRQFNNTFLLSSFTPSWTMKQSQPRQLFWILLRAFCTPTFSPWAAQPHVLQSQMTGAFAQSKKTPSKKRARCWENHFNPTLTHITCSTLPFPDIAPITPHEDFYIHQLLKFCHSLSNKPSRTQLQTPTKVFAPETACVADCVADSRLDKHSETWTLRGNRGRVWPISWHLANSTNYQQDSISVLVTVSYISIIPLNHQATNLQ